MSSLPPEIWGLVIDLLPHHDQRACLFLSKLHHDFAFPNVFSHVTVTFGLWIWRPWTTLPQRIRPSSGEQEHMVRRKDITLDILQAISSRPEFAKVITEFTVHACTWANSENGVELERLIAALEVLSNLKVFRWYGLCPMPSIAIFEALGVGSLATLTEIRIPMLEDVDCFSTTIPLSVAPIALRDPTGNHCWTWPQHRRRSLRQPTRIRTSMLTRLSVSGDVISRRESFSGLHELELIFPISLRLVGFDEILRHCTALTSLTILPTDLTDPDEIFPALGAQPHALPNLTAFKYLKPMDADPPTTPQHVAALCEFLKCKRHLRRLDVVLQGEDREEDPFFELLRELPALEVLGFDFMRGAWLLNDDIAFFQRVVPARLSALRVGQFAIVHDPALCASYRAEWLQLFKSLTSLRYLHILENFIALPETDTALRLRQLPIEELPGSLELYGYGLYMFPVVQEPVDNSVSAHADSNNSATRAAFGACWPVEKVAFRTKEDFGCEDWEWLLRWHDYTGLDMLRPGVLPNGPPLRLSPNIPLPATSS